MPPPPSEPTSPRSAVPTDRPAAEADIDATLVRALLEDQHPDLAHLALRPGASGWDNEVWHLGDALAVRLPRRSIAVPLIRHEQRWLPELAPRLPLPVPAPVRIGRPGHGYPWPWSVTPWFPGRSAAEAQLSDAGHTARALGAFLMALHRPAPADAPDNPVRGMPLAGRVTLFERDLAITGPHLPTRDGRGRAQQVAAREVRRCWEQAMAAPDHAGPPIWVHGDLHPGNLVLRRGRLAAVVDFGDLTGGDPATDLSVAWMLLPPDARPLLREAAGGADDDTWARARGWALAIAVAMVAHSADAPAMAELGARTLHAVVTDPAR